jgi:hypothetical protein
LFEKQLGIKKLWRRWKEAVILDIWCREYWHCRWSMSMVDHSQYAQVLNCNLESSVEWQARASFNTAVPWQSMFKAWLFLIRSDCSSGVIC